MSISAIHCPGGPSSHWSENWGRGGSRSKSKKFSPGLGSRYGISRTKTTFFFTPSLDLVTLVVPYPAKLRPKTLDFAFPDSGIATHREIKGSRVRVRVRFGVGVRGGQGGSSPIQSGRKTGRSRCQTCLRMHREDDWNRLWSQTDLFFFVWGDQKNG